MTSIYIDRGSKSESCIRGSQLIRTHTDEYINWCVPLIFKKISRQHLHEDGLF